MNHLVKVTLNMILIQANLAKLQRVYAYGDDSCLLFDLCILSFFQTMN